MKVEMAKIRELKERIVIPLYFCGDETKKYVVLDEESIRDEFEQIIHNLEVA